MKKIIPYIFFCCILLTNNAYAQNDVNILTDEKEIAKTLWNNNSDVKKLYLNQEKSQANIIRASEYINPSIIFSFNQVPMAKRLLNSPNYKNAPLDPLVGPNVTVTLNQKIEFGKRDLKIDLAKQNVFTNQLGTISTLKEKLFDSFSSIIKILADVQRINLLKEQLKLDEDLKKSISLTIDKGFLPAIELEKINLEIKRLQVSVDSAILDETSDRLDYRALTVSTLPKLTNEDAANSLGYWAKLYENFNENKDRFTIEERVINSQKKEDLISLELAKRVILPDPEFNFGYTYDTLTTGNIAHYLSGSIAFPMPIFQKGEPETLEAKTSIKLDDKQKEILKKSLEIQAPFLKNKILTIANNLKTLESDRLISVNAILERLNKAFQVRGITLSEYIQARRTVLDLQFERIDLTQKLAQTINDYRRLTNFKIEYLEEIIK